MSRFNYVVSTQKNHLNELPKHNYHYVKTDGKENINDFTLKKCAYLNLCFFFSALKPKPKPKAKIVKEDVISFSEESSEDGKAPLE